MSQALVLAFCFLNNPCPRSSTDRTWDCGSWNRGSIPREGIDYSKTLRVYLHKSKLYSAVLYLGKDHQLNAGGFYLAGIACFWISFSLSSPTPPVRRSWKRRRDRGSMLCLFLQRPGFPPDVSRAGSAGNDRKKSPHTCEVLFEGYAFKSTRLALAGGF